ncbi:hypothetical protein [Streptomyces sp. NPDC096032]|uniref:hypothetical protein n=1 Tax=Streptomyces sp. NPDC096032 TaxID=3366070 RepID=UPI003802C6F9
MTSQFRVRNSNSRPCFAALRVTSQLATIKLHTIAQDVITWAHTHKPLAAPTKKALDEALRLLPRADGPTS